MEVVFLIYNEHDELFVKLDCHKIYILSYNGTQIAVKMDKNPWNGLSEVLVQAGVPFSIFSDTQSYFSLRRLTSSPDALLENKMGSGTGMFRSTWISARHDIVIL